MTQLVPLLNDIYFAMSSVSITDLNGLMLACFALVLRVFFLYNYNEEKLDNKCPRCAAEGVTVYVLPVKHCPRCGQPC